MYVGESAARKFYSTLLGILCVLASLHGGNFSDRRFPAFGERPKSGSS